MRMYLLGLNRQDHQIQQFHLLQLCVISSQIKINLVGVNEEMRNAISIISTSKEHVEYIKELLKAQENNEGKTEEIILSTNQSYEKDRLGKVRTSNHEKYPQFLFCEVSENKEKRIIAVADFINLTDKEVTKDNKDKYNLILRNLRKVDKSSVLDCAVGDMVDNNNTSIPLKDLMDNACNGTTRFYITWPEY